MRRVFVFYYMEDSNLVHETLEAEQKKECPDEFIINMLMEHIGVENVLLIVIELFTKLEMKTIRKDFEKLSGIFKYKKRVLYVADEAILDLIEERGSE